MTSLLPTSSPKEEQAIQQPPSFSSLLSFPLIVCVCLSLAC